MVEISRHEVTIAQEIGIVQVEKIIIGSVKNHDLLMIIVLFDHFVTLDQLHKFRVHKNDTHFYL